MFLLCALSLAGEWRSANLHVAFESNAIIPYTTTIPLPAESSFLKPMVLKIDIKTDAANFTRATTEELVKDIVGRFSTLGEQEVRKWLESEIIIPYVESDYKFSSGKGTERERHALRRLVKLERSILEDGRHQVRVRSAVGTATIYVDLQCRVVDLAGRVVVKDMPRFLESSESLKIHETIDRVVEEQVGDLPWRVVRQ